jgi:hypothetical protein
MVPAALLARADKVIESASSRLLRSRSPAHLANWGDRNLGAKRRRLSYRDQAPPLSSIASATRFQGRLALAGAPLANGGDRKAALMSRSPHRRPRLGDALAASAESVDGAPFLRSLARRGFRGGSRLQAHLSQMGATGTPHGRRRARGRSERCASKAS